MAKNFGRNKMEALRRIREQELSISLQHDIREVLQGYEWRMNTAETREEISMRLKAVLENFKQQNLLYNYRVICNNTNNTPDDIDNHLIKCRVAYENPKSVIKILDIALADWANRRVQPCDLGDTEGKQIFCEIDPYGEENW